MASTFYYSMACRHRTFAQQCSNACKLNHSPNGAADFWQAHVPVTTTIGPSTTLAFKTNCPANEKTLLQLKRNCKHTTKKIKRANVEECVGDSKQI